MVNQEATLLHGGVTEGREVWGIFVPTRPNGRNTWPDEIKRLAVQKIITGARVDVISKEIGANPSLVGGWLTNSKKTEGEQSFVEALSPLHVQTKSNVAASECIIRLGDVEVAFPTGFPLEELTNILRAVRASF